MSDEELHRVDTVPPPDGEGDAYNAPTRVGAGPPVQVLAELREAAAAGRPLKPQALPQARPTSVAPPATEQEAAVAVAPEAAAEVGAPQVAPGADTSLGPAVVRVLLVLAAVAGIYALVGR